MLDELVVEYMNVTFQETVRNVIYNSFDFIDIVKPTSELYDDLINLINQPDEMNTEDMSDIFIDLVKSECIEIFEAHSVVVAENTSLEIMNVILLSIINIQELSDFTFIDQILSSYLDASDTFSDICNFLTGVDKLELMESLHYVDPILIETLKVLSSKKAEDLIESKDVPLGLIKRFKMFNLYMGKKEPIGIRMVKEGYPMGEKLSFYLSYMEINDYENTLDLVLDLMSLLLLSSEAWQLPVSVTYKIVPVIGLAERKIEPVLKVFETVFEDFAIMETEVYEQNRISETVH